MTTQAAHEAISSLTTSYVASRCLQVVAELGVADGVGEQATQVGDLAARCGVDHDALRRVLGLLASYGVFEVAEDRVKHTPASLLLRDDDPRSMRAYPRMMGLPIVWNAVANLEHSLRTAVPAVETIEPRGFWAYFGDHHREAEIFADAMTAKATADVAMVLATYDFSQFDVIADIGGGRGHLLAAVLESAPDARGLLFELPDVVDHLAVEHDRMTAVAGDFFADPLPPAQAYLLIDVLHDYGDDDCLTILRGIRRAAPLGATVLVVEGLLGGATDSRGHVLDIVMLVVTGGRERTPAQLDSLFKRAGFSGAKTVTAGSLGILEAKAV